MYLFFNMLDSNIDDKTMKKQEPSEHTKLTHILYKSKKRTDKLAEAIFHNFYKFNEIYSSILICIKDPDHLVAVLKFCCFLQSQNFIFLPLPNFHLTALLNYLPSSIVPPRDFYWSEYLILSKIQSMFPLSRDSCLYTSVRLL